MLNKIILLSFGGILFFSGCSSIQKVEPIKIKKNIIVKKQKNEITNMFNDKFHFKNKKMGEEPIYQIMYQNYN